MKYLMLLIIGFVLIGCGNKEKTVKDVSNSIDCRWIVKKEVCLCFWNIRGKVGVVVAKDSNCNSD